MLASQSIVHWVFEDMTATLLTSQQYNTAVVLCGQQVYPTTGAALRVSSVVAIEFPSYFDMTIPSPGPLHTNSLLTLHVAIACGGPTD